MQGLSVCLVGRPQKELFSNYDDICGLRKISKVGVNLLSGCGLRTIFHQKFVVIVNDLRNVIWVRQITFVSFKSEEIFKSRT